jgi:hypothetical protein
MKEHLVDILERDVSLCICLIWQCMPYMVVIRHLEIH